MRVMHRRGTVRSSPKQYRIDAAVTFVTLPTLAQPVHVNSK